MNIKIAKLFNGIKMVLYLHLKNMIYLFLILFIILFLILKDPIIAFQLIITLYFYFCIHEFGHILFLVCNNIRYKLTVSNTLVKVSFHQSQFLKKSFHVKLMIILGGPALGLFYCGILIYLLQGVKHMVYFLLLLIICEMINMIFGQDGRMLERLLKERKLSE